MYRIHRRQCRPRGLQQDAAKEPQAIVSRNHGRLHIGQIGSTDPHGELDEKLKSENIQKEQFSMFMLSFESNQGRQV